MTVARSTWGANVAMTITLAGLAADSSLAAGRASNGVDITAISSAGGPPIDLFIGGQFAMSSAYSAGAGGRIEVWAGCSIDGIAYGGNITTADAAFTPQNKANMKPLGFVAVSSLISALVSSQVYEFGPFSLAQANGGVLPPYFSIFVTQNLATSLNSQSSMQAINYTPVWYASS